MSASTILRYGSQSAKVNAQQRDINLALERIMSWEAYSLTVIQGCESNSVGASGGTHAYKQSEDLTPNEEKSKEKFLRILGQMHYIRPAIKGVWSRHNHGGVDWTTNGGPAFNAQLRDYHLRLNALANRAKDPGYHMLVFPKNIYGGYIGYVEATTSTHAYEQQTTKSHAINAVKKGQITYVVAETEVAGKRWYVTLTGKCIMGWKFKKIKKPAGATPTHPDVHPAAPKPTTPAPTTPPVPPKPVVPDSVALNIGSRNVIYNRYTPTGKNPPFTNVKKGLAWASRLPLLAKDVATAKLHLLGTQEAGTYKASEQLEKAIEKVTGKNWENILHGDDAGDITQGSLWETDTLKLVNEGKVKLTGTDHDWLVWTRTNIIGTDVNILEGVLHLEWHAGGKSTKGNVYDKKRETQTTEAMNWMKKNADEEKDVVVLHGDFNSTAQFPYDGPGKAAKACGFRDAEGVAEKQVNTEYDSYHNQLNPKHDEQYDRFMLLESQLESGLIKILAFVVDANSATKKGSDHYQTHIETVIKTK